MSLRDDILAQAKGYPPLPYGLPPRPGETDCSLFVRDVFAAAGAPFPAGVRTAEQERQVSIPIGWDDVQPGDLLFFEGTYDAGPPSADGHIASHVGISLGKGSGKMWDAHERAASPAAAGITVINPSDYWQPKLFEARRAPMLTTSSGGTVAIPTMPRGVDVASYQGNPDWAAVAASGVAFAFTKATEATSYVNPTFVRNWSEIKAHGMVRGAYHFARPDANNPEVEAEHFIGAVMAQGLEAGDLLALDLEDGSGDLSSWTLRFLQHVKLLAGFDPLVYTSAGFADAHSLAALPEIGERGLWLASWQATLPPAPDPWGIVAFWQYTDSAQVPGISGAVDGDRFNGPADRIHLYGKPGAIEPPPPPDPPPADWRSQIAAIRAACDALEAMLPA